MQRKEENPRLYLPLMAKKNMACLLFGNNEQWSFVENWKDHNSQPAPLYGMDSVLKTLFGDFAPYWYDSVTQLLHIHDANLPFHHTHKVLYWNEICVELIWVQ